VCPLSILLFAEYLQGGAVHDTSQTCTAGHRLIDDIAYFLFLLLLLLLLQVPHGEGAAQPASW
jgi:hypothetical protein